MEPLLILLVIPTIAFMMLRADSIRVNGLDPEARERYRKLLPVLSIIAWGVGVFFLGQGVRKFHLAGGSYELALVTLARLGIGTGMFYLGWKVWQVFLHVPDQDLPLQEIVRRDQQATAAKSAAMMFILLPLALPSMIVMSTVGLIPLLVYSFSVFPQQYLQNQLLWTLALATKNDMDVATEVHSLTNSMIQERSSRRTIVLRVLGVLSVVVVPILLLFFIPWYFRLRKKNKLVDQMSQLSTALYDGVPLARALSLQPELLPSEVVGAIEAASETGDVGTVLTRIALDHSRVLERRTLTEKWSGNAATYAMLVCLILFQVIGFIMIWIVPKYKAIFEDFGVALPELTVLWIEISDWFIRYWYLAGPIIFLPLVPFVIGAVFLVEDSSRFPSFVLRIFPRFEAPMLLRRLGYVAANKMQLQPSLGSLAKSMPDLTRSRRFERLGNRLELGDSLGQALQDEGFVNARESHSIDNAAAIGHLGWALPALAHSIQQRRINRSRWFMEFIRPAVIVFLGFLVASFCIAMFLPLVKLLGDLS